MCLGSSVAERFLGKKEVEGPIPSPGSIKNLLMIRSELWRFLYPPKVAFRAVYE